ncbi:bromo adjacent homology (BAH) domain, Transcription factor IIS [Artemisia annua]|uniref:Bromo adjacent homology (BAH) domain, Transcription factor IIS n=1 Tax=Artemisia annua TaxID=35608 RepID=A0A2U1NK49_ARTAN|nr:bromo adjacent homology (BAH) domain, Transcription factor IIS [Artemisia annua]
MTIVNNLRKAIIMYGRRRLEGEKKVKESWHMWPVPSFATSSVAKSNSFVFIDNKSFTKDVCVENLGVNAFGSVAVSVIMKCRMTRKDGRKINVGDCALIQPLNNSLPFIGRIRKLIVGKENSATLSVNWLYRPADVKLKDGALLEAAPNEVFYSFHKDEIPVASLLHPCKVTFLRKGVELPSGLSSFVCRRVYDIEKGCFHWLTDKNYINDRQEEVDQLLDKTRIEMHGVAQTGGRSPKPVNGPNGTAQVKPSSDTVQNSSSSISSHTKSKKREHGVHNSESVKRERLSKVDDADSGQSRPEDTIKTEIAKITDKGGLVDFGGVEKLIQLMRPDSTEKKLNLASRTMLVDVISVTDRFDCLGRFVQLRGLSVLDEWLQEIHKGKIGNSSPKVNDKSVEEFLFALLRALDRLPVNLHALQTCNVGKSVNHLRSHKNTEIQKKARGLVNTWKRRVEAEMNVIQTKSSTSPGGSWPNKSHMSEVSPMGIRRMGGSSEVGPNTTTSQPPTPKAQQPKPNSGEAVTKSPTSPGSTKLSTVSAAGAGSSDMPSPATKDGRSVSSSQSPNNSQSCSSDHGKNGASCREDARSSAAGSSSATKISSSVSHSKNSSNGFHGVQKEGSFGKVGTLNRNFASEKVSPARLTSERVSDVSHVDNGNSQRLIVRLPNTSRSPARTATVESPENSSTVSGKGSQLVSSEKQDHHDQKVSGKVDTLQGRSAPSVGRDLSHGKDEAKVIPVGLQHDERDRNGEKMTDASVGSGSSSGITPKPEKIYEPSYSSINALVESCAKISEASVSPSVGDDVGMNLLASVAAGELSRSDASPACSPSNISVANGHIKPEHISSVDSLSTKGISSQQVLPLATHISGDSKDAAFGSELKTGDDDAQLNSSNATPASEVKPAGLIEDASAVMSFVDATNGRKEGDGAVQCADDKPMNNVVPPDVAATGAKVETQINEESASWSSSDMHQDEKKLVHKRSDSRNLVVLEPHLAPKSEEAEQRVRQNMDSEPVHENLVKDEVHGQNAGNSAPTDGPAMQEVKPCDVAETNCTEDPLSRVNSSTPVAEVAVKLDFDLNEVLPSDDGIQEEVDCSIALPSTSSAVNGNRPALITVAAAAKGPFYPSDNLLRGKSELGWKGSAATSAFRPAEPRKAVEGPLTTSDIPATSKQGRPFLDFDLNVGVVDDASLNNAPSIRSVNRALSGGGLDLDLNACEENPEAVQLSFSSSSRPVIAQLPPRLPPYGGLSISESNSSRGFDLNNGPGVEEIWWNGVQFMSAIPNVRMNNMDMGNFSTWLPPNNTYPATIPSIIPGRGEQSYPVPAATSQRMLTPVTASTSLTPEMFRGPVLSSSPAVAYPSTAPFQYSAFPFETNFSLPSISNSFSSVSTAYMDSSSSGGPLCFPSMPSQTQLVGPNGVVSMPYRPYFMSLPGGSSNVGPDGRKWGSQGLDLNAGPGTDDKLLRQIPLSGSQGLADEQQLKMYQQMAASSGVLKRKEPDGGWDGDRISYKPPSWQ